MMKADAEGKVTEVLAYLREKDAAEQQPQREIWGWVVGSGDGQKRRGRRTGVMAAVAATTMALAAFISGFISIALMSERPESGLIPLGMMIAFWVAGGVIAWLIARSAGRVIGAPSLKTRVRGIRCRLCDDWR